MENQLLNNFESFDNSETSARKSALIQERVGPVSYTHLDVYKRQMFIDLMDASGKIQIFSHKENLSEEQIKILKLVDIGDIVGFTGTIRRTPRGELSIKSTELTLLSKRCV